MVYIYGESGDWTEIPPSSNVFEREQITNDIF